MAVSHPLVMASNPSFMPEPTIRITSQDATTAASLVTQNAGCLTGGRDNIDNGFINEFKNFYVTFPNSTYPSAGDYPTYSTGNIITDDDYNGIENTWQSTHGCPSGVTGALKQEVGQYYWIERYINSLIDMPYGD
ncbi:MAG: hypothetical protein DKM50_09175 [Candidatus Margulisiibacteriota bacterium]|nr:MAG: hypothetical protein A2X43_02065 [Candidatus Margulisbacteria bacterium GWD2_39_127]PZM79427.1 MAG: hypothetical protein DKM50_09175 [Candidatus Margulisiibacteriota bacterium]HAR63521.1 hypothetical protein [Candidatus Margulisiibacteriota bacterium]